MKKIDFEEAIKALEEGKKVYKSDGKAYYERKTILHYNFNDEDYNKYEARNNNPQEWESLYLPEEPKPFEITETGLYKTRDGRIAMINEYTDEFEYEGVVLGEGGLNFWKKNGKVYSGQAEASDIIGKWGNDD